MEMKNIKEYHKKWPCFALLILSLNGVFCAIDLSQIVPDLSQINGIIPNDTKTEVEYEDGFYYEPFYFDGSGSGSDQTHSNETVQFEVYDFAPNTDIFNDTFEDKNNSSKDVIDTFEDTTEAALVTTSRDTTINLFSENSTMNMTTFSVVGLLKHVEINLLKQKIKNMETSNDILKNFYEKEILQVKETSRKQLQEIRLKNEEEKKSMNEAHKRELNGCQRNSKLNQDMHEMEMVIHQNTKDRAKNSDVVLKLLMEALKNLEQEIEAFRDMNDSKEMKIKFLELKNKDFEDQTLSLTNIAKIMQGLVKQEEVSKKRLQNVLLKEREICQTYGIISKLDMETPDYLQFMSEMGKNLLNQHTLIEELNSHFEDEKSIESSLDDVLVELDILNSGTLESNNTTKLVLDSCQSVVKVQGASLATLRPHISYLVTNHSGMRYKQDEDGTIIEARQCQCLPEVPQFSNIQALSVKFSCPAEFVTRDDGKQSFDVVCGSEKCPEDVDRECIENLRTPWTEWNNPCAKDSSCLASGYVRTRKSRAIINESFKEEIEIQSTGSKYLLLVDGDETFHIWADGTLGFFLIGGGGGGDKGGEGGSSGFFKYERVKAAVNGQTSVKISIGQGGSTSGGNGTPTYVAVDGYTIIANGGGGNGGQGWSEGGNDSANGFYNGGGA
eukprot:GFUD01031484.1.p1 GENE.GFUD01031484.1~~GFUD01031484.1.p1  ORF type:complete len:682 (-),score=170.56 GFUD01031484.1:675-2681(-)